MTEQEENRGTNHLLNYYIKRVKIRKRKAMKKNKKKKIEGKKIASLKLYMKKV